MPTKIEQAIRSVLSFPITLPGYEASLVTPGAQLRALTMVALLEKVDLSSSLAGITVSRIIRKHTKLPNGGMLDNVFAEVWTRAILMVLGEGDSQRKQFLEGRDPDLSRDDSSGPLFFGPSSRSPEEVDKVVETIRVNSGQGELFKPVS